MNSIEIQECNQLLGTSEDVTMEDYFTELNVMLVIDVATLKSEFKSHYSDITDWSF